MFRASFQRISRQVANVRKFGAGGGHHDAHDPFHAPEFWTNVGKGLNIVCFLWIMFQFKANKGQIFNLYHPWLHEHEHHHFHFTSEKLGEMPILGDAHHHDDHEEDSNDEH